jgi:endonuclease G
LNPATTLRRRHNPWLEFFGRAIGLIGITAGLTASSWARIGADYQLQMGNPSGAAADSGNHAHYLIQRPQYAMDYNDTTRQANWVSWSFTSSDFKAGGRTDAFASDSTLPAGFSPVGSASFGSGFDRGHMCPSADRSSSAADNTATFLMSNMIPQASANNQGVWNIFEMYCRDLGAGGNEVLIICGPGDFGTTTIGNGMRIPSSVWKIALVVPPGTGSLDSRTSVSSRVIAIRTPNNSAAGSKWQSYLTSVAQIEANTGLTFFSTLSSSKACYLRKVTDTGTGPNSPTVIASFSPASGPPGCAVTITGYNFGSNPVVRFSGITAAASVQNGGTQISATVPTGTTTGTITVTSPANGTDTSAASYTVEAPGFAGWTTSCGLSGTDAELNIAANDGIPNLLKYALNLTPPQNPATTANAVKLDTVTGTLRLTVTKNPAATDISYGIEGTGNLVDPQSWSADGIVIDKDTATTLQAHDSAPLTSGRRFLRLKVTRP